MKLRSAVIAAAITMLSFVPGLCDGQQPRAIVGTISSTEPVIVDGTAMSPSGAPAWPLVEKDEIATSAPALLTTVDRNLITFDAETKAKIGTTEGSQTYIYLRQGGLSFETKARRVFVCAGNRLFVPDTPSKGVLRIEKGGLVFRHLDQGIFLEQGARGCNETGPVAFLSGLPAAAGGTVGGTAAAGTAGLGTTTAAVVAAGAAVGAGTAVATGIATSASGSCLSAGCNFNPAAISPVQP